jgi:hypothetical protein
MSRLFDDASSQTLASATAPLTAAPLTMVCWFNSDDIDSHQVLMSLSDTASDNNYFVLTIRGASAGDFVQAVVDGSGDADGTATTSSGYSANTWHHAAAVFASTTSQAAYIDGGSKGSNTSSAATPLSVDAFGIGFFNRLSPVQYMSGKIAEAAIWNVALNDAEIAALAKGYSPLLIRPQSLVAYWPLFGNDSPEPDRWKNRYDLTLTNAPTKADHPRIYYPSMAHLGIGVAAPVTSDLLLMF